MSELAEAVIEVLAENGARAGAQIRNLVSLKQGFNDVTPKQIDNLLQRMKNKGQIRYKMDGKVWFLPTTESAAAAPPPALKPIPLAKEPETSDNGASNEGEKIDMDNASDSNLGPTDLGKDLETDLEDQDLEREINALSESLDPAKQDESFGDSVLTQAHIDEQKAENKRLRGLLDEAGLDFQTHRPGATARVGESFLDEMLDRNRVEERPPVLSFNVELHYSGNELHAMSDDQLESVMMAIKVLLDSKRGPVID